jgi:hypothetical protein
MRKCPLWLGVFLLGLVSCYKETSSPAPNTNVKTVELHKYYPTFAVAKIPAAFLQQQGVTYTEKNGWNFGSIENQEKVATYVLTHPDEFSLTVLTGNFVPLVYNHQQTSIELVPDPQQQASDFDRYGMKISQFSAGVEVKDDDDLGNVNCNWSCSLAVELKQPQGGSTGIGQSGAMGGPCARVGQPQMHPYFTVKDITMWVIHELNRK